MDKEDKRFWAAALILGGMSANYHHTFMPNDHWVSSAVRLADLLLITLSEKPMKDPIMSK